MPLDICDASKTSCHLSSAPAFQSSWFFRPSTGIVDINRIGTVLLVAISLSACSQAELTAGSDLGTAGQKAAQAMKQAAVLNDDQLLSLQQAMTFHNGYVEAQQGAKLSASDIATATAINKFEATIAAQSKFLDSLSETYAALAALSAYDTAGKFNTSFGSLSTDSSAFIKALDPKSEGLPKTATSVVQQLGSLVIAEFQRQQIVEASKRIREPLQAVIKTMSDQKKVYEFNLSLYVTVTGNALHDLYKAHLLSCAPVLDHMGAVIGVKSVPNADQVLNRSSAAASALQPYCDPNQAMLKLQKQMIDGYENSLTALNALLPLHAKLEAGEPLDLNSLIELVNQIKPLVQAVKS